jgi:hypothetical protein
MSSLLAADIKIITKLTHKKSSAEGDDIQIVTKPYTRNQGRDEGNYKKLSPIGGGYIKIIAKPYSLKCQA